MRTLIAVAIPVALVAVLWFGAVAPTLDGITRAVAAATHQGAR